MDASFYRVLDVALVDLRLHPTPGSSGVSEDGWDMLGSRLLVFAGLAILAISSTAWVGVRLVFGRRTGTFNRLSVFGNGAGCGVAGIVHCVRQRKLVGLAVPFCGDNCRSLNTSPTNSLRTGRKKRVIFLVLAGARSIPTTPNSW